MKNLIVTPDEIKKTEYSGSYRFIDYDKAKQALITHISELIGKDYNLYEKERNENNCDWRVQREEGANEEKHRLRKLLEDELTTNKI